MAAVVRNQPAAQVGLEILRVRTGLWGKAGVPLPPAMKAVVVVVAATTVVVVVAVIRAPRIAEPVAAAGLLTPILSR